MGDCPGRKSGGKLEMLVPPAGGAAVIASAMSQKNHTLQRHRQSGPSAYTKKDEEAIATRTKLNSRKHERKRRTLVGVDDVQRKQKVEAFFKHRIQRRVKPNNSLSGCDTHRRIQRYMQTGHKHTQG